MQTMLMLHIAGGALGIVSGFVALYVVKGAGAHRRAGILFVCSMVTMALAGAMIAAVRGQAANLIIGLLTAYLVVTALTTIRPATAWTRRVDVGATLLAAAIGLAALAVVAAEWTAGDGLVNGVPAPVLLVFGTVALASSLGDVRTRRAGGVRGSSRLVRHLWRMCFALFIASTSFFLGQADELPEPIRILPLLAIPAFAPLPVLLYWLWRVRARRILRGIVVATPPEPAATDEVTRPLANLPG